MKVTTSICDACYFRLGKDVEATQRYGFTNGLKFDFCDAHCKEAEEKCHNPDELATYVMEKLDIKVVEVQT